VWWHTPVILAFRRQRQEDHEFQVRLDYIVRPCLKTETKAKAKTKTTQHNTGIERWSSRIEHCNFIFGFPRLPFGLLSSVHCWRSQTVPFIVPVCVAQQWGQVEVASTF
jgi:hypothetical protein